MTAVVGARRLVSASELQRAWRAVQAGQFKEASSGDKPFKPVEPSARPLWRPGEGEHVLPVVGCAGSLGASTTALGLACAAEGPARILECCSGTASGLAAASSLELGVHRSGWNRGTRGSVVLERASGLLPGVAYVPFPSLPDKQIELTVVDVGWELGHVLVTTSWIAEQIRTAGAVVVVTCATIPGFRHLESTLGRLAQIPTVGAVLGPSRRHWPKAVQRSFGALTRDLDRRGRVIVIPRDPRFELAGIDSRPLPSPLLEAARSILKLTMPAKRDEQ